MGNADPEGQEDKRQLFELEDEPEPSSYAASPPARDADRPGHPPQEAEPRGPLEKRAPRQPQRRADEAASAVSFLDERRKRRLLIYGPVMMLLYLLVGWFFAGSGLHWFALAGLIVGLFAGWRQRGEVLLGSIAAVAGFVASYLAVSFPLFFVIIATGIIGFLAGIDDKLRNS